MIFAVCSPTIKSVSLKLYLISCELADRGDYRSFKERLRTLGATEVMNSQWAVRTAHTAAEIRDMLRNFLDDRDRITVAEIGEERASRRAKADLTRL